MKSVYKGAATLTLNWRTHLQQQSHRARENVLATSYGTTPPWSENVATNIGRKFFGLLERHYPDGHRYRKFTNRNYVKVSYSCMENMRSIITKHNVSLVLTQETHHTTTTAANERSWNCKKSIVYKATLTTNDDTYLHLHWVDWWDFQRNICFFINIASCSRVCVLVVALHRLKMHDL